MSRVTVLRAGLAFLGAAQLGVGLWALLAPESFFAFRWVGMGMAYNVHLVADYGALSSATAVVLLVAAVGPTRTMARTALLTYLVFAVPHLVVHLRLLHHLAPEDRVPLVTALATAVALGLVLLPLTSAARPLRGSDREAGTSTSPDEHRARHEAEDEQRRA